MSKLYNTIKTIIQNELNTPERLKLASFNTSMISATINSNTYKFSGKSISGTVNKNNEITAGRIFKWRLSIYRRFTV